MENDYLIYGLYCPMTKQYRYIGKSKNGMIRAHNHFLKSHNDRIVKWALEIKAKGFKPEAHLITTCNSQEEMDYEEIVCVNLYLKEGHNLLNKIKFDSHKEEVLLIYKQNKLLRDKIAEYSKIDTYIREIIKCKEEIDRIDKEINM